MTVLTPMALEARAIRGGAPWAEVRRTGMGPERAAEYARSHDHSEAAAVVIAGFCGALDPSLQPGDVVLASELRGPDDTVICADATILAGVLRRGGLRVHVAPIASERSLATGPRRRRLAQTGAAAVDLESAWLAPSAGSRPLHALRVVLDTPGRELRNPVTSATGTVAAYRSLRQAASLLREWASMLADRELVLASPRASCAGVERAIEIVERALEQRGAPVYVRRQIVHNAHVVDSLRSRGAVFVDEVEEVPPGATVVFSAHGVSPEVRRNAQARQLNVIDATCPLVAKVHAEARRFAAGGFDIVLVGHEGHEEIEGTVGEAPDQTTVIASAEDVTRLQVSDPEHVAYLTQTTLAVDETASVVIGAARAVPGRRRTAVRGHLLRDPEPPDRGSRPGRALRSGARRRFAELVELATAGRGRPPRRVPQPAGRGRVRTGRRRAPRSPPNRHQRRRLGAGDARLAAGRGVGRSGRRYRIRTKRR